MYIRIIMRVRHGLYVKLTGQLPGGGGGVSAALTTRPAQAAASCHRLATGGAGAPSGWEERARCLCGGYERVGRPSGWPGVRPAAARVVLHQRLRRDGWFHLRHRCVRGGQQGRRRRPVHADITHRSVAAQLVTDTGHTAKLVFVCETDLKIQYNAKHSA